MSNISLQISRFQCYATIRYSKFLIIIFYLIFNKVFQTRPYTNCGKSLEIKKDFYETVHTFVCGLFKWYKVWLRSISEQCSNTDMKKKFVGQIPPLFCEHVYRRKKSMQIEDVKHFKVTCSDYNVDSLLSIGNAKNIRVKVDAATWQMNMHFNSKVHIRSILYRHLYWWNSRSLIS